MKLAIHNGRDKAVSWNSRWIDYCETNDIPYLGVDCYAPNIIEILRNEGVTHLMWAFSLALPKDLIMAKLLLNAAEQMGIKVFPNFNNRWHFEDKIAQKYLLEAIEAPIVKSWAFFDEDKAIDFVSSTQLPLVAKLRKGAGSNNVVLLRTEKEALKYIHQMFTKGKMPSKGFGAMTKAKIGTLHKKGKKTNLSIRDLWNKMRLHMKRHTLFGAEKGYVYFQEFLSGNKNDLRIAIVGKRAWGFYRGVRPNDFRASGSGLIDYATPLPLEMITKSFEITQHLKTDSLCFDYVKDSTGNYQIVEICYGYVSEAIYKCSGYWDEKLQFHEGHFMPDELILQDFINSNTRVEH